MFGERVERVQFNIGHRGLIQAERGPKQNQECRQRIQHEIVDCLVVVLSSEIPRTQLEQLARKFALDLPTQMGSIDLHVCQQITAPQNSARLLDIQQFEWKGVRRIGKLLSGKNKWCRMAEMTPVFNHWTGRIERRD